MSLKKQLRVLTEFAENPYDAEYRPEKEMRSLFIKLMVTLPIFLGFCCQFYILISGPLFIYWIVLFVRTREFWKALGWKMRWRIIPTVVMAALGIFLAIQQYLVTFVGWVVNKFMFYI